jgi:hypothetical protein
VTPVWLYLSRITRAFVACESVSLVDYVGSGVISAERMCLLSIDNPAVFKYIWPPGGISDIQCELTVGVATHGHAEILEMMHGQPPRGYNICFECFEIGIIAAAAAGHLSVVKYILQIHSMIEYNHFYEEIMKTAAQNGRLNILKHMYKIRSYEPGFWRYFRWYRQYQRRFIRSPLLFKQ